MLLYIRVENLEAVFLRYVIDSNAIVIFFSMEIQMVVVLITLSYVHGSYRYFFFFFSSHCWLLSLDLAVPFFAFFYLIFSYITYSIV